MDTRYRHPKSVNGLKRKDWILDRLIRVGTVRTLGDGANGSFPFWSDNEFKPSFTYRMVQMECKAYHLKEFINIRVFYANSMYFGGRIHYHSVKDELSLDHFLNLIEVSGFTFFLTKKDVTKIVMYANARRI